MWDKIGVLLVLIAVICFIIVFLGIIAVIWMPVVSTIFTKILITAFFIGISFICVGSFIIT